MRLHRCDHCGTRRLRIARTALLHERAHQYDVLRERLLSARLAPVTVLHPVAA